MELKMSHLEEMFTEALRYEEKVGVAVTIPGCDKPEIIINPTENLENKLAYYKGAYNDDLELKSFNQIKIVGFACSTDVDLIYEKIMAELGHE
jgi:hypothetical protein